MMETKSQIGKIILSLINRKEDKFITKLSEERERRYELKLLK